MNLYRVLYKLTFDINTEFCLFCTRTHLARFLITPCITCLTLYHVSHIVSRVSPCITCLTLYHVSHIGNSNSCNFIHAHVLNRKQISDCSIGNLHTLFSSFKQMFPSIFTQSKKFLSAKTVPTNPLRLIVWCLSLISMTLFFNLAIQISRAIY